jgi:hypothetical protein
MTTVSNPFAVIDEAIQAVIETKPRSVTVHPDDLAEMARLLNEEREKQRREPVDYLSQPHLTYNTQHGLMVLATDEAVPRGKPRVE